MVTSGYIGLYFAVLQLFFTLCWTVYAAYLPALAASAGIPASAVIFILMLDQAVFMVADFATGVWADRVSKVLGRIGTWAAAITLVSCAAFLLLPFIAPASAAAFLAVTILWTVTSSALRAPPLMLIGKYAAKPAIPWLTSLTMLGYGIAGAVSPYLAVTLRGIDPRLPFVLASVAVALTALGLGWAERNLASKAPKPAPAPQRAPPIDATAAIFALIVIVVALGYQLHFSINSAPAFLRFAPQSQLEWLMPVFWIGFNIAMFPAGLLGKRIGAYPLMAVSALLGGAALLGTTVANSLDFLISAQLVAGAAWGFILVSAFTLAFAIGKDGREGTMAGVLFSALAVATLARMAMVAGGFPGNSDLKPILQWAPIVCWALAGAGLLYFSATRLRALMQPAQPPHP
jgi:MFS family permease